MRESNGPQKRIAYATNAHLFAGQLRGDRSPIGPTASLGKASATSVGAFHDRWYRPDRAVVVISGDGDPAEFARLIAKYYGDWQADGPDRKSVVSGKSVSVRVELGWCRIIKIKISNRYILHTTKQT